MAEFRVLQYHPYQRSLYSLNDYQRWILIIPCVVRRSSEAIRDAGIHEIWIRLLFCWTFNNVGNVIRVGEHFAHRFVREDIHVMASNALLLYLLVFWTFTVCSFREHRHRSFRHRPFSITFAIENRTLVTFKNPLRQWFHSPNTAQTFAWRAKCLSNEIEFRSGDWSRSKYPLMNQWPPT